MNDIHIASKQFNFIVYADDKNMSYVFIQFTNRTADHFNDSAFPQYQCEIE